MADFDQYLQLFFIIAIMNTPILKNYLKSSLLLAGIAAAGLLQAQTELDPVTVTSSLHPVNASATGRNIFVIKGEYFSHLPVHSVDELLRYLPGLEVQMRGPMGAQSDIVLRGGTFQQVLVILDGTRLNDPNTGHFSSYIPIAPAEIDRIEILKGASSAVFGTEAVGGVIQIITKTFAAKKGSTKKEMNAQVTTGQYDMLGARAGGFWQKDKTAMAAGILTTHTSGQPLRGIRGFVHNTTGSASFKTYLGKTWQLSARSAYDNRDFAAQNFYTAFVSDTATEQVSTWWNQMQVGFEKENRSFVVNVGYKRVSDRYQYNSISTANTNKSQLLQGLALYKTNLSKATHLTTGLQWINKQIESNDRGDHNLNQLGGFVLLNQNIGSHLKLNPAIRTDWNERSGWELVPQINISYKITQWQLRASAGKTTRDADFTERFNNYNKAFVASGSVGNPNLQSEHSFSYEAGADYFGLKNLKVAATLFRQEFSDLIDYVPTPYAQMPRKVNLSPTGTYAFARNMGRVTNNGFEADIQYYKKMGETGMLWSTIGLTWISSESDQATPSFYISSHAKFISNVNISYSYRWFAASLSGLYKHRQQRAAPAINALISGQYFVCNVKMEATLYKKSIAGFVQVDNLLDESYSDLLGSKMPGRWVMGGLKLSL